MVDVKKRLPLARTRVTDIAGPSTRDIRTEISIQIEDEVSHVLPQPAAISRMIQRRRESERIAPANPLKRDGFEIPYNFTLTMHSSIFNIQFIKSTGSAKKTVKTFFPTEPSK